MNVCLSMIVGAGEIHIARCLESVKPVIGSWCIQCNGPEDGTQQTVRETMAGISGELWQSEWKDFALNRTAAIRAAQNPEAATTPRADYLLFLDADDYLEIEPGFQWPALTHDCYEINIRYGGITYQRTAVVRASLPWHYVGVVHEYLECARRFTRGGVIHGLTIVIGGKPSGPEKYAEHARLIEAAMPDTTLPAHLRARYQFYLAQSYKDSCQPDRALAAYLVRAEMGGFDEEVFQAKYQVGLLTEQMEGQT